MNNNISFIFFTYNEEKRIAYAIKNCIAYGKVYLMDGGSTDNTQKIAESLGATFYTRPDSSKPNVETQTNFEFIKSIIDTDWIYWGYVDNIAPQTLMDRIVEITKENKYKSIMIPLYTYLWGNTKNYALRSHAPFVFHKDYMDFTHNYIHGLGQFLGKKEDRITLPNKEEFALKHFSTYNVTKFVGGHMRYGEAEAREKFEKNKKFSLTRMFAAMLLYAYIFLKYNYKNGKLGVLIILNYMFYRVMTYTRLYEFENNITLESIENNYSKKKEEMLSKFR